MTFNELYEADAALDEYEAQMKKQQEANKPPKIKSLKKAKIRR